jgi:hypothetical protein
MMATTKPTTRKSLAEEVDSKEQMHRLCLQLSRKIERSLKDDFQIRRVDAETLGHVFGFLEHADSTLRVALTGGHGPISAVTLASM